MESRDVALGGDEFRHARSLRLREGDVLWLSNGVGLCAEAVVVGTGSANLLCRLRRLMPEANELPVTTHLLLGIIEHRERFEFALEKAVELGIRSFTPLVCERGGRKSVNMERLNAKALAAMKQCRRARLPVVCSPRTLVEALRGISASAHLILADPEGEAPVLPNELPSISNALEYGIFVGPEGGFSAPELETLRAAGGGRLRLWRLAPARLRAETAAAAAVSAIAFGCR